MKKNSRGKRGIFLAVFLLTAAFTPGFISGQSNQQVSNTAPDPLVELKKQHDKLALENEIAELSFKKSLAAVQAEIDTLESKIELAAKHSGLKETERKAAIDDELFEEKAKLERLKLSNDIATAQNDAKNRALNQKSLDLQLRMTELKEEKMELENKIAVLDTEIELREKKDILNNRVKQDIQYTTEPFKNGALVISDRRIALDDVITMESADYVVERINYFNNQNRTYPIFIVIDSSPGGSVMAGYRILKAMSGSPAPVYVVVKSYAASMAANITTQAKRSFAYPNAIILHHQILGGMSGNLTEQKESVKETEEWWKRLATPVAQKMGISLDEFIKQMYAHRSTGDWMEFGDTAKKLKWVDEIVETISEESYVKNPDLSSAAAAKPHGFDITEQTDQDGRHYKLLPRLDPVDVYYIYNPDDYYRLAR